MYTINSYACCVWLNDKCIHYSSDIMRWRIGMGYNYKPQKEMKKSG